MGFQDRILQKRREDNSIGLNRGDILPANENIEECVSQKFFGIENNRIYPSCLDLRMADGRFKAIPYSYIVEINFDASEGIEIITATKLIVVEGRNLQLLYNYLTLYRVKYIQANIGFDLTDENTLFVREIKIEEI